MSHSRKISGSERIRVLRSQRTFSIYRIILNSRSRTRIRRSRISGASAEPRCPTEPYSLDCTCISDRVELQSLIEPHLDGSQGFLAVLHLPAAESTASWCEERTGILRIGQIR